ncbi:MAG: nucleotidyl transferase AbiEii/AbiGii toxin family protein [Xanthobacteraceae bacterium]
MPVDYLHNHPQFADLIRIVAAEKGIDPALVEKDYWIMHCLYGLQQLGLAFQLKGGTSLSKGHKTIARFSEDIDILIEPPPGMDVKTGRNQDSLAHIESRRVFYDWLANEKIRIDGITKVERDNEFDDDKLRSAGIRLSYATKVPALADLREGVLLELGFDTVAPNEPRDISSWLYDHAAGKVPIIDNCAKGVPCYDPRYTFVEKLQTISTKYRKQRESGESPIEFMRHYYDVYGLLERPDVQAFIGTELYNAHKQARFRQQDNQIIAQNEGFILSDPKTRALYAEAFERSTALYYGKKPSFEQVLNRIGSWINRM